MTPKNVLINKISRKFDKSNLTDSGSYTFLNPFSYLFFRKNLTLFSSFDGIYIDGIVLVRLLRIFGIKVDRVSFDMTSLAPLVIEEVIKTNKSIYFIGSTTDAINGFIKVISNKWPKLKIASFRNGYFSSPNDRLDAINDILHKNPEVVVIGMGTPYQEQFLVELKENGFNGAAYTCGGFIHQTTNKVSYYPLFYDKFNLRWLYRMIDEPKLIKRYVLDYPKSTLLFVSDFLINTDA
ncbi:WecB/TagA/CpsF family glycosyltransferase [Croceivirga radicis]|uniref:WecB/TagA/CpsF family glycosyltransferase n=1 Tax=Croceivirga radicis TaxID=1929488 RepID=UPI000255ACD5|nr:WecB/TagA/CpsF family glycosyltransferase [Croceivirga radicis]